MPLEINKIFYENLKSSDKYAANQIQPQEDHGACEQNNEAYLQISFKQTV